LWNFIPIICLSLSLF
ncbi:hypothetical protein D039_2897B, partial [Vibrio parahaemolyticus EKP-028]